MLTITVLGQEHYDESKAEFFTTEDVVLRMEHSLVSLSKWEAIHKKPFITKEEKTSDQVFSYIKCMVLHDLDEEVLSRFSTENLEQVSDYLNDSQTATWFYEPPGSQAPNKETITSELIYYWMIAFNIPFSAETWNLSRLFTLIKVCNAKNGKPKKMSADEIHARNRRLNEQRKAELGTTG